MGFGSFLKGAVKQIKSSLDTVFDAKEMEAVVAGCALVAGADGEIDPKEFDAAVAGITAHPSLKNFKAEKIGAVFKDFANMLNADMELAKEELKDRLKGITERPARIRLMGICKEVAMADGTISKEEQAMLDFIRQATA